MPVKAGLDLNVDFWAKEEFGDIATFADITGLVDHGLDDHVN
jgi:hypothetical protein